MDQEVAAALMPNLHSVNSLHGTAIRELSLYWPVMSGIMRTFTVLLYNCIIVLLVLLYYLYCVILLHLLIIVFVFLTTFYIA
mgnify:CR=1 FL=1